MESHYIYNGKWNNQIPIIYILENEIIQNKIYIAHPHSLIQIYLSKYLSFSCCPWSDLTTQIRSLPTNDYGHRNPRLWVKSSFDMARKLQSFCISIGLTPKEHAFLIYFFSFKWFNLLCYEEEKIFF